MPEQNLLQEQDIFNLCLDKSGQRLRTNGDASGDRQRMDENTDQEVLNIVFDEENNALKI
jgi:hypothetical protein